MKFNFKKSNKKSMTEIISFVLITLIIVVASISAYVFSKSSLEKNINSVDYSKMTKNLNLFSQKIKKISAFQDSQMSFDFSFKIGQLNFKDNQVNFQTMKKVDSSFNYCEGVVCFKSENNYERIYINLTDSYSFDHNLSLVPGNYILTFKNIKNETKIQISLVE